MSVMKSTLCMLGLTALLAACDPGPTSSTPAAKSSGGSADFAQMGQYFKRYAPLPFKPMRIAEARANLKARGYVRSNTHNRKGSTSETWRGVYTRGGKNVARGWVSLDTCPNSQLLAKTRVSLNDMTSALASEMLSFVRKRKGLIMVDERQPKAKMRYVLMSADRPGGRAARDSVPRGQLIYSLGGIRIFDNGERRVGVSTHTSCG